jgi:small-conductance mechanosensitive channel
MQERRIVFHLDVTYDTDPEKVERLPAIIREIIEAQPLTRFDRSHFLLWMESALRIETVYYVLDPGFLKYADIQHAINVELLRRFAAERIHFAFPSRTVHVQHHGGGPELTSAHSAL